MAKGGLGAAGFPVLGSLPLICSLVSLPLYSLGETIVWFRFPLFAMAVTFWLVETGIGQCDAALVGVGMMLMCLILVAEISIIGVHNDAFPGPMAIWFR